MQCPTVAGLWTGESWLAFLDGAFIISVPLSMSKALCKCNPLHRRRLGAAFPCFWMSNANVLSVSAPGHRFHPPCLLNQIARAMFC